jgi:hypothetical protein
MNDLHASIRTLGRLLDDLQEVRIRTGNRIGALERQGFERLPHLAALGDGLDRVEHQARLELCRLWRKHPLAEWAKGQLGVGEISIARLIAEIGHPRYAAEGHFEGENSERAFVVDSYRERTVSQLWAYCGHGDPAYAGSIPAGATQAELFKRGNPRAKCQVHLIAEAMLKAGNRDAYDADRLKHGVAVHAKPCKRCGPSGHPAEIGSPWSLAHQHASGLRVLGKQFLLDLWLAAEDLEAPTRRAETNDIPVPPKLSAVA